MKRANFLAAALISLGSMVALAAPQLTTEVLVLHTAPVKLPQLTGRRWVEIQNQGSNAIYCALGNNIADAGAPVFPDGGSITVSGVARKIAAAGAWGPLYLGQEIPIWCVADTGDQSHAAATTVTEGK